MLKMVFVAIHSIYFVVLQIRNQKEEEEETVFSI